MNVLFMDKKREGIHSKTMSFHYTFEKFIKDQLKKYNDSEEALAEAIGISARTVYFWLNQSRQTQQRSLEKISKNLGIPIENIIHWGQEENITSSDQQKQYFKWVPYLEAKPTGSEGEGLELSKGVKAYLAFDSQWIHSKGSPKNMGVMRVTGPSMEPTLPDGALILVDMSQREPVKKKIFVVEHCDGLQVKRLNWVDSAWVLESDNDTDPIRVKPGSHFKILGKVLWVAYEVT